MPKRRAPIAAVVCAILLALPATAYALTGHPAAPSAIPQVGAYGGDAVVCDVATVHFKIWWDDRRSSPDAPFGADGSCGTVPLLVARIALQIEGIRQAELALGFPAPPSDAGTSRNGGDGRFDLYVHRPAAGGETARAWCMYEAADARVLRSWSFVVLGNRYGSLAADDLLRETIAHEYFHAIQCQIAGRLDVLPAYITEGTANWMAALVAPRALMMPRRDVLPNLLARLAGAAAATQPVTGQSYEAWAFWYTLTGGARHPERVGRLLARLGRHPRRAPSLVRATAQEHGSLLDTALAARALAPLAGDRLPDDYASFLPLIDPPPATHIHLRPLGYSYHAIEWLPDAAHATVRVVVHRSLARTVRREVALVLADGTVLRTPAIRPGGVLEFSVSTEDEAGGATLVLANSRGATTSYQVTCSR